MSTLFSVESGFGEAQGRRDTMEDAHVLFDDILQVENIGITAVPGQRVSYYGVYDGHGGVRFSRPPISSSFFSPPSSPPNPSPPLFHSQVDTAKLVQNDLHKNIVNKPKVRLTNSLTL